jgi:hypothetical protein
LGVFRDVRTVAWGPDGLVISNFAGQSDTGLFALAPTGGDPVSIAERMRWPSVLSSGRIVATNLAEPRGITLLDPKTGTKRLLLAGLEPSGAADGYVFYNRQSKLVAHRLDEATATLVGEPIELGEAAALRVMSSDSLICWVGNTDETRNALQAGGDLAWITRAGQRTVVPGDVKPYGGATLDLHGDQDLATTVFGPGANGADVITVRLDTGAARRVYASPAWDAQPRWSRDGTRLVFRSQDALFIADATSTARPEVVVKSIPGMERVDDWSPDGRHVLVSVVTIEGRYDIRAVDLTAGGAQTPFAATPATESFARFSPDGSHVVFVSDATGPPEVYVQAFQSPGPSRRVSASGGTVPKWSRDGSRIYFFSPDGWIMEAPVTRTKDGLALGTPMRAAPGSGVDFMPSADGQRFLLIEEPPQRPVVLINWRARLAR